MPRRVASAAGAAYYNLPVGAIITAEAHSAASASGKKAPRGGSKHSRSVSRAPAQAGAQRPATGTGAPAATATPYRPDLLDGGPSFAGTVPISVGGLWWAVPPGAEVRTRGKFTWVCMAGPTGPEVRCLLAHEGRVREVDVPARMREEARLKYFAEAV
jgi:hypothetical protein